MTVTLVIPARTENIALVRQAAGIIAARCDLTIDEVEDFRLAVDEATAQLITAAPDAMITCAFHEGVGEVGLRAWSDALDASPFDHEGFGWTVMGALVDGLEDASTPAGPAISLRLRRRETTPA